MRLKTLWITLIAVSVLAGIVGAGNGTQNQQAANPFLLHRAPPVPEMPKA